MPTITNNTTANYGIPLPSPSNRLVDDLSRLTGALTSIDALLAAKLDLTAYTAGGGGASVLLDENNHIYATFMPHMYGDATSVAGTAELALSATGVTAGTYKSVTVDAKGRVTAATNPNTVDDFGILDAVKTSRLGVNGGVATLSSGGTLTSTQIPAFTGDVTNSGTTLTLADSGVTAGSYNSVTVDIKGRVTAGSNIAGVASGLATLNSSSLLTTSQMPALTGDITSTAGTVATALSTTGVSAGTYNTVTVDAKGRVTSGTNVSASGGTIATGGTNATSFTAPSGTISPIIYFDGTKLSADTTVTHLGYDTASDTVYTGKINIASAGTQTAKFTNTAAQSATAGSGMEGFCDPGAAMLSGNRLGFYTLGGAVDAAHTTSNAIAIEGFATQNWTSGATGSKLIISTTPNGSTNRLAAITINQNQSVDLSVALPVSSGGTGATTLTGILKGNGTGAFTAASAGTDFIAPSGALGTPISGNFSTGTFTWPTFNQNTSGTAASFTSTTQNSQFNSIGVGTAASATAGEIRATNNVTAYYSDERLKTNITLIPDALDKVMQISGVTFNANELAASFGYTNQKTQVGVIAQEIERVLPQIVVPAPFDIGVDNNGNEYSISGENFKTVQYDKLVPLLIEAIKELTVEVNKLKGVN